MREMVRRELVETKRMLEEKSAVLQKIDEVYIAKKHPELVY